MQKAIFRAMFQMAHLEMVELRQSSPDKGKPIVRSGRKAMGLFSKIARLPKENILTRGWLRVGFHRDALARPSFAQSLPEECYAQSGWL